MSYYRLHETGYDETQWHISVPPIKPGETEWWDVWAFARCEFYCGETPIHGEDYDGPGRRTSFTSCEFNSYVVSKDLGEAMRAVAPDAIQLVSIQIDEEPAGEWYILNILDQVDCIDFERSKVEWGEMNREGEITCIYRLEINQEKAIGHHIFRLAQYPVQVLVSEEMAKAMNAHNYDGFLLVPLPWHFLKQDQLDQEAERRRNRELGD